ncbi:MAG: S8 family peptidase [Bacteroidia bacterium]|nr:S8 family peptidase [Bacteroidia bacterium]
MKRKISILQYIVIALLFNIAKTYSQSNGYIYVKINPSSTSLLPSTTLANRSSHTGLNQVFIKRNVVKYRKAFPNAKANSLKNIYAVYCTGSPDSLKKSLDSLNLFEKVKKVPPLEVLSCPNPYPTVNDTWIVQQWAGNWAQDNVEANCAWSVGNVVSNSANQTVGLVDTELDVNHEDLQNGKIVSVWGNNTLSGITNSHGTRSAGVIAANTNNNLGISSLGYNTKIAFYAVGYWDPWPGIWQAYLDGYKIISVSYRITGESSGLPTQEWIDAVTELTQNGCLLVVGAGNISTQTNHQDIKNIPGVMIVSGINSNNEHGPTGYSHYDGIDLCAPSQNVTTTEMANTQFPNGQYVGYWGTSSATPQVATTAALVLAANSCLSNYEIEEIIKSTTEPIADASSYTGLIGTGRLNAYKAVLKASQWGNTSLEVTNGQNITLNSKMMYDNIYVRTGGTLTISNTTIYMDNWGKIVVEKGGKLFINNSIICAHPVNSCITQPYVWKGIEVEGQPTYDQYPTSNQGYVSITNNSILKDARNCISTFPTDANGNIIWSKAGGGIIIAYNSIFRNNWRHVELTSYHRPQVNGVEQNNLCRFSSCVFETDLTQLTASSQAFQKMFTNWDTKGVGVYGCTFKNTNGGTNMNVSGADHGTGILSYDAPMFIQDYITYNPNPVSSPGYFYDLSIGIEDYHSYKSPLTGHIIKKNIFERDIYGIQQTNGSNSHIYRNTFKMEYPTFYPSYTKSGFWGINAGGFQISENTFSNTTSNNFNEIGSTFKHSRANGGGLYMLNTHTSTNVGGQTEQENQLLEYKCNGHVTERNSGILFNPKNPSTAPKDPVSWLPFFGSCFGVRIDKDNTFNSNTKDIFNNTSTTKEYVIDPNRPNRPRAAFCVAMSINSCATGPENCSAIEPAEPTGWVPVDGKKPVYLGKKADVINDKQPILDGAAQSLLDLIAQGTGVSANDLYDALNAKSPYLSDAVLIAMLQYSQHLSEQQAVDILVSNSRLTAPVVSAFSYRNFSQSALNTIDASQSEPSAREILEADIEQGERELNQLRIDLLNYYFAGYLNDTLNNYGDSTIAMLEDEDDELSIKQLLSIYLSQGETTLASQKLALLDDSDTENEQFIALMNIFIALKEEDKNVFQISSGQEEIIRDIAATSTNAAYCAKAILSLVFEEFTVERPVLLEEGLGKRGNETSSTKETATAANNNLLKVYPNPASSTAIIDYMFTRYAQSLKITVSNIAGATLKTIDLKQMSGQYEMDVQTFSPGVYFIELRGNDALIAVKKLIVNK